MNEHMPVSDEFLPLLNAACDGVLSEQQLGELVAALDSDVTFRRAFTNHVQLVTDMHLLGRAERACDGGLARVQSMFPRVVSSSLPVPTLLSNTIQGTRGYFSEGVPLAYVLATVIFGVGLLIGSRIYVSGPKQQIAGELSPATSDRATHDTRMPFVGRITGMADCEWADQKTAAFNGASVPLGRRYALRAGLMEITYETGAKVILQGPVVYEVESHAGGYLSIGKLTARVDKRAEGGRRKAEDSDSQSPIPNALFFVRTPAATVTDLGTEFGVEVSEEGQTQVHVLQGIVEARGIGQQGSTDRNERLTEGKAVEVGSKGDQIEAVPFAPQSFTRKLHTATDMPAETAYINAVLADKPMGYWPLNEPAGAQKFLDHSGNNLHGYAMHKVLAGQPGPLSSASRAIELDGDGYIDLGYHPEFAMKNDFTVEAWVWIGPVKRNGMVFAVHGAGENPIGWGLSVARPGLKSDRKTPPSLRFGAFRVKDCDFPVRPGETIEDRWLHVVVVYDQTSTAHLYLDGQHCGSVATDSPADAGPAWLTIGCAEPTGSAEAIDAARWRGRIAHVAVYSRALGTQQIQTHYGHRNDGGKETPGKHP